MDTTLPNPNDTTSSPPPEQSSELAHITQEMYKQNLELAERNKTLSLLRQIDEIILGSVTDTKHIAEQVATAVVTEADFKVLTIHLLDKKSEELTPLAISQLDFANNDELNIIDQFQTLRFSMKDKEHPVVKAVDQKQSHVFHHLKELLAPLAPDDVVERVKQVTGIEALLVYPIIIRTEVIGVMMIGIAEAETSLSQYQRDLINRLVGVVGIAIDNALLYQKIQEANERLKEIDKLKDEFVSLASHELRTPMTIIKNYLWMLIHDTTLSLTEKQKEYMNRAYSSTDRLILLVNDMLNVSRIESGRFTINLEEVELIPMLEDTITEIMPRAEELKISLVFNHPSPIPKKVKADSQRLKQVLINLIGNSLKFTPEGGTITVEAIPKETEVYVKISDTGAGMTKEDLSKLFQKFGTVGNTFLQKKNTQGTGLGLYITRSIVELHHGKIWAESEGENKGSAFTFTLPYSAN